MSAVPPVPESVEMAARLAARLDGCNCDPVVGGEETDRPGTYRAVVRHDPWCAHPSQVIHRSMQ